MQLEVLSVCNSKFAILVDVEDKLEFNDLVEIYQRLKYFLFIFCGFVLPVVLRVLKGGNWKPFSSSRVGVQGCSSFRHKWVNKSPSFPPYLVMTGGRRLNNMPITSNVTSFLVV